MATTTNPTNSPASSVNLTTMENPSPSVNPSSMENQPASVNPSTSAQPTPININTTQPLLAPSVYSKPLISERLIIRTYVLTDLLNFYTLNSQPEPNVLGRLNREEYYSTDFNNTLKGFSQFLRPWGTGLYYGIFTKKPDGQEDDYIGHISLLGNVPAYTENTSWPSINYKLKKEYWGQGYATEAIKTFTSFWWSLPRVHTAHPRMDPSEMAFFFLKKKRACGKTIKDLDYHVMRWNSLRLMSNPSTELRLVYCRKQGSKYSNRMKTEYIYDKFGEERRLNQSVISIRKEEGFNPCSEV